MTDLKTLKDLENEFDGVDAGWAVVKASRAELGVKWIKALKMVKGDVDKKFPYPALSTVGDFEAKTGVCLGLADESIQPMIWLLEKIFNLREEDLKDD